MHVKDSTADKRVALKVYSYRSTNTRNSSVGWLRPQVHCQTLSCNRQISDVTIGQSVVSDRNLARAIVSRHKILSDSKVEVCLLPQQLHLLSRCRRIVPGSGSGLLVPLCSKLVIPRDLNDNFPRTKIPNRTVNKTHRYRQVVDLEKGVPSPARIFHATFYRT